MFAMCVSGLGPLASRELEALDGVTTTDTGSDGRSDVVLFEVERGHRDAVFSVRTVEDLFVEVGRALRADGDNSRWIAQRIWRPQRVTRALSIWAENVRPLASAMSFRVIARVLDERSFRRTELRRQMTRVIGEDKTRWRVADPAQIEVWISEYGRGKLVEGLRLTDAQLRQHDGRAEERKGALRPTVAAAMISLAGNPGGVLLDPCCGSGTIPHEAGRRGFEARGTDLDLEAIETARKNTNARIEVGDARSVDLGEAEVAACVSNLPFGRQFAVEGDADQWVSAVLAEMARVTCPGGRIVVLVPHIKRELVDRRLRLRERFRLQLLGTRTTIWVYDRI